ncbi:hypothetical protein T281_10810 [Rhodomicrobium udaipurense JA643]|uniref:Glycosyltransferase n=1 Tax=Rhodomicrobium udaipurense TaxID=1202716 RepID=A0A8I1GCS2_9HYPH|nr:glycosyltransferase [Rhodomicrobium udaipurense]KAI94477.1 hypothetical protein T281_10810 [Rhodomicrobium udaipurense JA643]MBJ7544682.1 glycosyltransferase [Rhodomicrobium udaipurense]
MLETNMIEERAAAQSAVSASKIGLKILMSGHPDPSALPSSYLRALAGLGCQVFPYQHESIARGGIRGLPLRIRRRIAPALAFAGVNRGLLDKADEVKPDAILIFKGMELFPDTLKALRSRGIKLVSYNPDHPFAFYARGAGNDYIRQGVPLYDLHVTYSRKIVRDMAEAYPRSRVAVVPFGHDVSDAVFRSIASEGEILRACFIGNADELRRAAVQALLDAGIPVDVFGPRWLKHMKPSAQLGIYGPVFGEDMHRAMRRYRVQLNFFRPHNLDSHNMRTFEVPASGGIMLAEDSPEHRDFFEADREAFFFRDVDEMAAKAHRILELPRLDAEQIREAARRRCDTGGYSYAERARALRAEIEKICLPQSADA